jgi:uncharacterized protein (DUF488 family)
MHYLSKQIVKYCETERAVDLYTIGYEGLSFGSFVRYLRDHNVMTVVDIREKPISRKKGFSKTELGQGLASNHINYIHVQALGTPKNLRDKLNKTKDYFEFFKSYNYILETKTKYINEIIKIMIHKTVALVCFEKDACRCHRNAIAQKVQKISSLPVDIHHIETV